MLLLLVLAPLRASAQEWEVVRLSFGGGLEALPAIVAQERGLFVQERLVVSTLDVGGPEEIARSLQAGTTDVAAVPQSVLLLMAAGRLPVTVVAMTHWDTQLEFVAPAHVGSIRDLKGRRVAVGTTSDAYPLLIRLLNREGLRPNDVTIRVIPDADLPEVFANDIADALFEGRRVTSSLVEEGAAQRVLDYDEIRNALGVTGAQPLVARDSLIAEDPATLLRFVRAWLKALVYINQEPDDAAGLLQVFLHRQGVTVSRETARDWIGMTSFDRHYWAESDLNEAQYNAWALREAGVFDGVPSLEGYVDSRFARRAWQLLREEGPAS